LAQAAKDPFHALTAPPVPRASALGFGDSSGMIVPAADTPAPFAQDLASALSAVLVPELNEITAVFSETLAAFKASSADASSATLFSAVASLETSTEALKGATEDMREAIHDLASRPALVAGMTPDQLQAQLGALDNDPGVASEVADFAGNTAIEASIGLALTGQLWGAGIALGGGIGLKHLAAEMGDNDYFEYDEEAEERLNLVKGFPEYNSIKDGWFLDKYDIQHNQKQGFLKQVEFFSERLRELDETANKDTTAYMDEPRELFMREQANALRELYAKMLLELLARSKSAGGVGEESFDAGALELARQYGDKTTDKIAPAMGEVTQTSPMKMEPIDVQIKVLSDHRLSIHSVNPNPNVNLSVDMRCGPNGLLYGIPG
jgi:hypothetical protein